MQKLLLLHGMILLMGLNPLFAKLIDMPALSIIWGRLIFTSLSLFLVIKLFRKTSFRLTASQFKWVIITGICFGFHWWTYFQSIQFSTVAVGLCALFTYPIITGVLEPMMLGGKHKMIELLTGVLVTVGVIIIVPEWDFGNTTFLGILLGVASAFLFSLRNIWGKKYLNALSPDMTMFYQVLSGSILFLPFLTQFEFKPTGSDLGFLLLSGLLITPLSHTLLIKTFDYFSIKTVSVMTSLQILYSSIFAYLIFMEIPMIRTMIGGGIIFIAVVVETFWKKSP